MSTNIRYFLIEIVSPNYGDVAREKFTGKLAQHALQDHANELKINPNAIPPNLITNKEVVGYATLGQGWQRIEDQVKMPDGSLADGVCTGVLDNSGNLIQPTEYRVINQTPQTPPFVTASPVVAAAPVV